MNGSQAAVIKPSEDALVLLLTEVASMVKAKQSISAGLTLFENVSLGDLGDAATLVRQNLEQGKTLPEAFDCLSGRYQTAIRSTLQVVIDTRSSEPLYLLIDLIQQASTERKQTRLAAITPLLNATISACVLFLILPFVIQTTAASSLLPLDNVVIGIAQWLSENLLIASFAAVIFVSSIALVFFLLINRLNSATRLYREYAIFSRWIATQLVPPADLSKTFPSSQGLPGTDLPNMIILSSKAAGISQEWREVPEQIRDGFVSSGELSMPARCPEPISECITQLISGDQRPDRIAEELTSLSEIYRQRASYQRQLSRLVAPQIIGWGLIISVITLLLYAILNPVLVELKGTLF
ncbi:MAG: type II secretion system F family protein [Rubripirellula sp.]|nr:type II secretion system F family protein [Rubripirellula sp.]